MEEQILSRDRVASLPIAQASALVPDSVEINAGAMLASGASIGSIRLASDLIRFVWWPAQAPISFDVDALSAHLQAVLPASTWTPWRVRRYRAWAITFFREAGIDRWVPIADYYRLPAGPPVRHLIPARRG